MSPRTVASFCVVLAAGFWAWSGFQQADLRKQDLARKKAIPIPGQSPAISAAVKYSWRAMRLGRATVECPFGLNPVSTPRTDAERQVVDMERYIGGTRDCGVSFVHAVYPSVRGEIMLDTFSRALNVISPKHDFTRYPSNSGAVMVNGLRARRFDFDHVEQSMQMHDRLVVFTKGNQAWIIEVISREELPEGEQIFHKMAFSLKLD